jgi:hypothetical protein
MRREELLGAQLLSVFAAYKRRQSTGTIQFYSDRLLGLEDSLLQVRHQLLLMPVRPLMRADIILRTT